MLLAVRGLDALELEVHVLGGRRRKGMLSVQQYVTFGGPSLEVSAALRAAGFAEGLDDPD